MILLVPTTPEVPRFHRPTWGVSWILAVTLILCYFSFIPTLDADYEYVNQLQQLMVEGVLTDTMAQQVYLSKRPLLDVSIAPKSWSLEKAIFSNFLHGGVAHLILNIVGLIAGVRICTTFIPFLCTLSIFILGGTLGLSLSTFLHLHPAGDYVPHLGASAGLFALMGTYYVYNFRFRTTYFFWFPSRHGYTSLKTNTFFFVDVLLLELLLSSAQFFPTSVDGIDHLAHVGGFAAGCFLALALRFVQKWPSMLQTRGEFIYWTNFLRARPNEKSFGPVQTAYMSWIELLKINFFNDQVKLRLAKLISENPTDFSDEQLTQAFSYLGPTFNRLFSKEVSQLVKSLISNQRKLPVEWLHKTPYDNIIRLAQLVADPKDQNLITVSLIVQYHAAHKSNKKLNQKLENLISQMQRATESQKRVVGQ